MALESLSWKSTRKTPGRLAKKVRPNLSDSALNDPGYEDRAKWRDVLNIASGLPGAEIAMAKGLTGLGALAGVVKPKGGNWISGSVEDALRGLKRGDDQRAIDAVRRLRPDLADREVIDFINPQTSSENLPINQWIEGPLTKYVKTRMASPEDEVRKLAEQGVLHVEPASLRYSQRQVHPSGEHLQKLAQNPDALKWENAADFAIYPEQARTFKNTVSGSTGRPTIERNPWLASLSDDAPVYDLTQSMAAQDLGFPHLIDELSNALNPASGLPRNLQISPEAMKQMSMEKAVRRVAEINAWRAAQKVEANRKLAEQAALVREYAENNPKGLRWVELKAPEPKPLDVPVEKAEEYYASLPVGERDKWIADWRKRRDAFQRNDEGRQALADQLKYEGDTMGHCVGGYCDDVLSGRSRIFSLRDAKGEPHVTVEVNLANAHDAVMEAYPDLKVGTKKYNQTIEYYKDRYPEEALPSIVQIKGKQNRAPNEEYLPFVQDFVRNNPLGGQWSDVGDLGNTGLTKHPTGKFVTDAEANALFERHFGHPPDSENAWQYSNRIGRYDKDMLTDIDLNFLKDWKEGKFAQGGPVSSLPAEPASGYNSWQSLFGEVA